jgi:riboflavin kinase/FMN adenylyltransferase
MLRPVTSPQSSSLADLFDDHAGDCVVTVGTFDGVHPGHRQLVREAARQAGAAGARCVAVTFSPRPDEVFAPGSALPAICSLEERIARLRAVGADDVVVVPFSREVAAMGPEEFVGLLRGRLRARLLCVGEDFALGRGRAGTPERIRALGLPVVTVELVRARGEVEKISSSAIRRRRAGVRRPTRWRNLQLDLLSD